jgi:4-amino-4-deoxy-L-arabinose transferase-like glycosyltransferase
VNPPLLIALLALGVRVYWLVVSHPAAIDNEGAEYARLAESILQGRYLNMEGTVSPGFPPLYPLAIAALTLFSGGEENAGRIVSLLTGSAFVLPIYGIAALTFGKRAALVAASLAALLPFFVELSTSVLSEMTFVTLTVSGIFFALRVVRSRSTVDACWCGTFFGLAALTRQEGLVYGATAALIVLAVTLLGEPRRIAASLRVVVAIAIPLALLIAPYAAYIRAQTGHMPFANKFAQNYALGHSLLEGMSEDEATLLIGTHLEPLGSDLADHPANETVAGPPSLGAAITYAAAAARRHLADLHYFFASPSQGTIVLTLLALVGLIAGPWSSSRLRDELILAVFVLAMFSTLLAVQHFWDRFGAQFLALAIVFAGNGVAVLSSLAPGRESARLPSFSTVWGGAIGALLVILLAVSWRDAAAERARPPLERVAGAWLRAQAPAGKSVMETETAIPYYGGARWMAFPYADAGAALRYIRKLHPDYLVLVESHAARVPYMQTWIANGIPTPDLQRAYDRRYDENERIVIYRWRSS